MLAYCNIWKTMLVRRVCPYTVHHINWDMFGTDFMPAKLGIYFMQAKYGIHTTSKYFVNETLCMSAVLQIRMGNIICDNYPYFST